MLSGLQLAVLDMAGTTVYDAGQVPRAFVEALAAHGIAATAAQVNAVRGASKREALRQFVPDGPDRERRAAIVYATFRERLAALYQTEGVSAIAGARETIERLRASGVRVALNTGFDRDITALLLGALQWDKGFVDAVVCGDDIQHGRPAPDLIFRAMRETRVTDANRVMNVGDTVLDLRAGHAAGVRWNVGVLTGAHSREQLELAPHTHLVASITEVIHL